MYDRRAVYVIAQYSSSVIFSLRFNSRKVQVAKLGKNAINKLVFLFLK
jgi:hypothetical protein